VFYRVGRGFLIIFLYLILFLAICFLNLTSGVLDIGKINVSSRWSEWGIFRIRIVDQEERFFYLRDIVTIGYKILCQVGLFFQRIEEWIFYLREK
jgi:hypothetical protein